MNSDSRQLRSELHRRLERMRTLRAGHDPRTLRLAGVYEEVAEAADRLDPDEEAAP